ncbi:hypothetical protein O77CONTIG1_03573 [Leptolyngbya sp. O-77]|nr:hypothetical protein O77CONTIG1_03573 [Leptolyngbya sp. O-77]
MNYPGKPDGNWDWRYRAEVLTEELGDRLLALVELYGRAPKPPSKQDREARHEIEPGQPDPH